jgi:dTDP-4-dehydrorhamnose 3,5-epimerase
MNLNGDRPCSILLPPGFGNAFFVKSDIVVFHYKWSYKGSYPDVEDQFTVKWNDPRLNIPWPHNNPILQERDR